MTFGSAPSSPALLHVLGETTTRSVTAEQVGSKAFNLMRLSEAGLHVPAGFVLGTELCRAHLAGELPENEIADLVARGVRTIERITGLGFGASRRPLLVSVRSGAPVSMPGMLETILDVGLTEATVPALLRATGDPVFVWDSYRRLVQSYGEVVEGLPAAAFDAVIAEEMRRADVPSLTELDVATLQRITRDMRDVYRSAAGHPFPQDPMDQLLGAVRAVWRSWNSARATEYRAITGLTELTGTAVTVQRMVFGNMGMTSGSGVGFTRDPTTGANRLYVDFLLNAQGEDVVAGRHSIGEPERLIAAVPGLAHELATIRRRLEAIFGDVQDFEFTVQEGRLWLLQTRTAQRTPLAALQIACDLVDEGLIDPATALRRLRGIDLDRITRARVDAPDHVRPVGQGTPAGAGVAAGRTALSVEHAEELARRDVPVILVRDEATTADVAGLAACRGLISTAGTRTCHAAVVARQLGTVAVVGCATLSVDPEHGRFSIGPTTYAEGDPLTVDGNDGLVYPGLLQVHSEPPRGLIDQVQAWRARSTTRPDPTVPAPGSGLAQ